jgi:hypothetical protein
VRTAGEVGGGLYGYTAYKVCPDARPHPSSAPAPPVIDVAALQTLADLCDAYVRDDKAEIVRLEPLATRIGEELNRRGGIAAMRAAFEQLGVRRGARTLEMHWGGIGEWRG